MRVTRNGLLHVFAVGMVATALSVSVAVLGSASPTSGSLPDVKPSAASTAGARATQVEIEVRVHACEDSDGASSCLQFDGTPARWLLYVNGADFSPTALSACRTDTATKCVDPEAHPDGTFSLYL